MLSLFSSAFLALVGARANFVNHSYNEMRTSPLFASPHLIVRQKKSPAPNKSGRASSSRADG